MVEDQEDKRIFNRVSVPVSEFTKSAEEEIQDYIDANHAIIVHQGYGICWFKRLDRVIDEQSGWQGPIKPFEPESSAHYAKSSFFYCRSALQAMEQSDIESIVYCLLRAVEDHTRAWQRLTGFERAALQGFEADKRLNEGRVQRSADTRKENKRLFERRCQLELEFNSIREANRQLVAEIECRPVDEVEDREITSIARQIDRFKKTL